MKGIIEKLHLEKFGAAGALIAALCCLGFAPFVSFLAAAGAGFLVNDLILAPLLVASLVVGGLGLYSSRKRHGNSIPLIAHIAAGTVIVLFTFVIFSKPLVWGGIALLLAAPLYDIFLKRKSSCINKSCEIDQGKDKRDG
ncbi:MAG: MerC domain-containing protein [Deltaproteobacteria bacterium]|nr:MAG: MerC domain-containing protein [Deltaproteobacteria bacterium]